MQDLQDIFAVFGAPRDAVRVLATAIGEKVDTVYRWHRHGRIPERSWAAVIAAVESKGKALSATDLLAANRTPKKRGRPARKLRPGKTEARAS